MLSVGVDDLKEGMVLCVSVYDRLTGDVLLTKGTILRESYIEKMRKMGIGSVYVEDDNCSCTTSDVNLTINLRERALESVYRFYDLAGEVGQEGVITQIQPIKNLVSHLVLEMYANKTPLGSLNDIRTKDNYTYTHGIDVAILSVMIGKQLGYTQEELKQLGLSALLHDIGKVFTPPEILNKPGPLTVSEFEEMQRHTLLGYKYLVNDLGLSPEISIPALQHHECIIGGGYPFGLKGDRMMSNSKIIAVADVFDALTSDRPYKNAISNIEAVEVLKEGVGTKFDKKILETALKVLTPI